MRTDNLYSKASYRKGLFPAAPIVLVSIVLLVCGLADAETLTAAESPGARGCNEDAEALAAQDALFGRLQQKYRADGGFRAYEARLTAATFLAGQMRQQLQKATGSRFSVAADELFRTSATDRPSVPLSVAPAEHFYTTSLQIFSRPVDITGLSSEERTFLSQYYNLKLRHLTSEVAKAGQALAIAEPTFKGTYDYALVLPLLHATEDRPVSVDVLPLWMRAADQLDEFSDSCLLSFKMPFFAMSMAREAAQRRNRAFSEIEFYRAASKKCAKQAPHVAVNCLERAMELVPEADEDGRVDLRFAVVQLWLDSQNYPLAAGEARKTFEMHASHSRSGQAIWLYYYALSRSNDTQQILMGIDQALDDARCKPYKQRLMYIKWWALRRQRDQGARVAALEHEMLKLYGDDPIVAPILLSQATDCLASQSYDQAGSILRQIAEKFPSTQAAAQARRMLEKLGAVRKGM